MTLLLASVTGPDEAALMLAHGADIIDLKDPSNGALGALAPDVVRATIAAVAGRCPVSAVTGDLPMEPEVIVAAVARTGADRGRLRQGRIVPGPRAAGVRARAGAPRAATKIIGVMFADRGADNDLVKVMAGCGFAGAMLDTSDKRGPAARLHGCGIVAGVRRRLPGARHDDRPCRIAGGARCPAAPLLAPDYLGFRGALCVGT